MDSFGYSETCACWLEVPSRLATRTWPGRGDKRFQALGGRSADFLVLGRASKDLARVAAEESNTNSAASAVVAGLAYAGLGALIGVGIDALSPGKKVLVYSARPPRSAARLSVRPIVLPTRQAIVARISF
jgi:hypothetical protein